MADLCNFRMGKKIPNCVNPYGQDGHKKISSSDVTADVVEDCMRLNVPVKLKDGDRIFVQCHFQIQADIGKPRKPSKESKKGPLQWKRKPTPSPSSSRSEFARSESEAFDAVEFSEVNSSAATYCRQSVCSNSHSECPSAFCVHDLNSFLDKIGL